MERESNYAEASTKYNTDSLKYNNINDIKLNLNSRYNKNEFIRGKLIGTGRFGSVYSGLSANTGEIVAIKIIKLNDNIKECNRTSVRYKISNALEDLKLINHKNIINYIHTDDSLNIETSGMVNINI